MELVIIDNWWQSQFIVKHHLNDLYHSDITSEIADNELALDYFNNTSISVMLGTSLVINNLITKINN